jgi:hypothetical protein
MKFEEVLPALRAGKKAKLSTWRNWALRIKDGKSIVMLEYKGQYLDTPDKIGALAISEILSDGWEVIE